MKARKLRLDVLGDPGSCTRWLPFTALLTLAALGCDAQDGIAAPAATPAGNSATNAASGKDTRATAPGHVGMDSPLSQPALDQDPNLAGEYRDADFRLVVGGARTCPDTAPFVPEKGERRVSISLTVEALGGRPLPLSPLNFRVVDGDGHLHGATLAGCEQPLDRQTLEPGHRATGAVAFDVPEADQELKLQFEPFLIGRPPVAARLPLNFP